MMAVFIFILYYLTNAYKEHAYNIIYVNIMRWGLSRTAKAIENSMAQTVPRKSTNFRHFFGF